MTPLDKIYPSPIYTSLSHKLYSLVKVSLVLYGFFFIILFANDFWFEADLALLSFILAPTFIALAHFVLVFQESPAGCHFFSPLFFNRPVMPYRIWIETCLATNPEKNGKYVDTIGLLSGNQMIPIEKIDVIELSFWGNLIFLTDSIAQPIYDKNRVRQGQVLFKLPAAACGPVKQKEFLELFLKLKPGVKLNKRLEKHMARQEKLFEKGNPANLLVKFEEYVPLIGACVFIFIFVDFAISTCIYLDTHKHYYLCQYKARHNDFSRSSSEFEKAESIRKGATGTFMTPVKSALFNTGAAASRLWQTRAEALYYMGKRKEGIESLVRAVEFLPGNYKINLEMARWLTKEGDVKGAKAYLNSAVEANSDSMIAKILVLNDLYASNKKDQARHLEKIYLDTLDEDLFGEEPVWPPGGSRLVKEGWIKDDTKYLLKELKRGYWSH